MEIVLQRGGLTARVDTLIYDGLRSKTVSLRHDGPGRPGALYPHRALAGLRRRGQ